MALFTEISETTLIEQAKTDPHAFGELYERHIDRIYNYIYYRVGNTHDAEDLTARVFQRALNNIERYEDQGAPFAAWLFRIAKNLVLNWHRDQSRRPTWVDLDKMVLPAPQKQTPEMVAELSEKRELLLEAVRQLPQERQDLLVLKFVDQQSNAEIGSFLGRSEGAIKSLYHRTLLSLKKMLSEHELFIKT